MLGNNEQVAGITAIESPKEGHRPQIEGLLYLLTGLNQQRQWPVMRKSRRLQRGKVSSPKSAETPPAIGRRLREATGEGVDLLLQAVLDNRAANIEGALRDFSGGLISAQEAERQRIARELHDDLSQRMAILSVELEQLSQGLPKRQRALRTSIEALWAKAQEISAEINRLSYELHPSKLEHLGLVTAVKDFCAEVSAHQTLKVEFRHQGFPAVLPKDVAPCVFRIVQELLHNVIRHSGARKAMVVLTKTDHAVHLRVSDEGCGFDVESASSRGGLGLLSLRERLRLVGGELSIRSQPSHGTQITVAVPLAGHAARPLPLASLTPTGVPCSAPMASLDDSQVFQRPDVPADKPA
jgi:signal transduction histidine kinase